MKARSKLSSILSARCPNCHVGKLFIKPTYNIKSMTKMHEKCSVCQSVYEKEPGAFYGAMFVSYGFSVAIFLMTSFILYYFFDNPSTSTYIISIIGVSLLLFPLIFRYSRILYLYITWKM